MRTYDLFCSRCGKVITYDEQPQIENVIEVEKCSECGSEMIVIFPSPADFFFCKHHRIKYDMGGYCPYPSIYDPNEPCGLPLEHHHEMWIAAECKDCKIRYHHELYDADKNCIRCGRELTEIEKEKFPNFFFKKMPQGWRLSASQRKELWHSDDINDFRKIG